MKTNMKVTMILLLLPVTLISCSNYQSSVSISMEEEFRAAVPVADMNQSIRLDVKDKDKNLWPSSEIKLTVSNESPYTVTFPTDPHIRIFTVNKDEWVEIDNGITYSGLLSLAPQGTPLLDFNLTRVKPIFGEILNDYEGDNILVRIVITGETIENDNPTGKIVGAYVDVNLER